MDAQVLREMRLLPKPFATFWATIGSAVRVDSFMLQQSTFLLKVLSTSDALEESQIRVLGLHRGRRWCVVNLHRRRGDQIRHRISFGARTRNRFVAATGHSGQQSRLIQVVVEGSKAIRGIIRH